jgi:hypothetical protein
MQTGIVAASYDNPDVWIRLKFILKILNIQKIRNRVS